ncbi:methyltransferase family protein [Glutamicibacter protophormiae]|uniref:methyltransferase family protein n=1 Tax=Glutamicibacter protophormiae TaxID=37930 RepID=UPI003A936407
MTSHAAPKIPPPLVVLAALGAQRMMTDGRTGSVVAKGAAGILAAASAGLAIWADVAFRAARTTVDPMHPERSTTLIVSGAYQASRNPIYLGMIGGVVAHGLWRGSMRALLPAVGVTLWLDRLQIPAEEEALATLYGEAYESYRESVPRWIQIPSSLIWAASRDRKGIVEG